MKFNKKKRKNKSSLKTQRLFLTFFHLLLKSPSFFSICTAVALLFICACVCRKKNKFKNQLHSQKKNQLHNEKIRKKQNKMFMVSLYFMCFSHARALHYIHNNSLNNVFFLLLKTIEA